MLIYIRVNHPVKYFELRPVLAAHIRVTHTRTIDSLLWMATLDSGQGHCLGVREQRNTDKDAQRVAWADGAKLADLRRRRDTLT